MRLGVRVPGSVRQSLVLGRRLGLHVMSGVRLCLLVQPWGGASLSGLARRRAEVDAAE